MAVNRTNYRPNLGFIGQKEVTTSNYLFRKNSGNTPYIYAESLLEGFIKRSPEEHYIRSQLLTEFIRKRGLTFSKKSEKGDVRIFSVPCTNSIVPLAKSTFNELERHAQAFVVCLRLIMQSIYGAPSLEESDFIKALPEKMRKIFIEAVKNCPQYFTELHDPALKQYPFFEVVGLDLVLVEDYSEKVKKLFNAALDDSGKDIQEEKLPFRLLEINAGSPSGASNNNSVLEGLMTVDPDFSKITDQLLPNDHFDLLRSTFDSIGRTWTKNPNGISVILPPGGSNGAAPEIHQLAAYSGMPIVDTKMLYTDEDGFLRLHTLSGENPVVTSIYSRVNADAALFNPEKNIVMKDAETGETLFEEDILTKKVNDKHAPLKDKFGNPIPLNSIYKIPGAMEKIKNRKLFVGGLNRILDNKLILATLTYFGPEFYKDELSKLGLWDKDSKTHVGLIPPETLPPEQESLDIILKKPEDWVIKAPDLSGGSGVHILLTLSEQKKKKILNEVAKSPDRWAYQKLVKIARIPVATKEKNQIRFANLAADIRLWCFFGDGLTFRKPRLTHNGLVRFAPEEKGPLSSIVNTSKGGGYAPLLIVDDIGSKESCSILELTQPKTPSQFLSNTPIFSGAMIYQIHRQILKLNTLLDDEQSIPSLFFVHLSELKAQLNEVLSFLHPRNVEPLSNALEEIEKKTSLKKIEKVVIEHHLLKIQLSEIMNQEVNALSLMTKRSISEWSGLNELYSIDPALWSIAKEELSIILLRLANEENEDLIKKISKKLKQIISVRVEERTVSEHARKKLKECFEAFSDLAFDRLSQSEDRELAYLFKRGVFQKEHMNEEALSIHLTKNRTASQWEARENKKLIESSYCSTEMRAITDEWTKHKNDLLKDFGKKSSLEKELRNEKLRQQHFLRYPQLKEYQKIIEMKSNDNIQNILKILNIVPYAKFMIENFLNDKKISFEELFSEKLKHARVTFLSAKEIQEKGLTPFAYGECFAQKRYEHSLFSESDIVTWISKECSPLIQAITIGHELIHYYQIEEFQNLEKKSREKGSVDFAKYLNLYGNFLGDSVGAIEKLSENTVFKKSILYGLPDLKPLEEKSKFVQKLIQAYQNGEQELERLIERNGSTISWMIPENTSLQLKALREVIPCLENIRNLHFAESLGLDFKFDLFQWGVPQATKKELKLLKPLLKKSLENPEFNDEVLYWIAQYQLKGIRTPLKLKAKYHAIQMSQSYGSAQQQQ